MKKIYSLAFLLVCFAMITNSCRKEGVTTTKVISVTLSPNQSYSYEVPHAGDQDDVMEFRLKASHALRSDLTVDQHSGNATFSYTPALDFSGSDEVQVANEEGQRSGHGGHCSGGNRHHDDVTVYDFKITVQGNTH